MKLIYTYTIIFLMLFVGNYAHAQNTIPKSTIHGVITDSLSKELLPLVTLILKSDKDSTITTTISKTDGGFTFKGLSVKKYHLVIISTGYAGKSLNVDLVNGNPELGLIYLNKQTTELKEVVISANKPIVVQKSDRIVYDMQADPDSKSSSVLGMIHKIPFLSVDADDNVLMKGSPSFKILINGKPSGMLTNNLKEVLRSMPASSIVKIEVITIPPSKYDAEGMAGVINIITTRKINDGYKGNLNVHENFPEGGPGIGAGLTIQQGKLGINSYGGGSLYTNPQTTFNMERITTGTASTDLKQSGTNKNDSKNIYFGTEVSYEIDSLHLLSGNFNISGYRNTGSNSQTSSLDSIGSLLQGYDLNNNNRGNGGGVDVALNYQLGFKSNKSKLLTFSYQFSGYGSNDYAGIDITNPMNYPTPDYKQYNNQNSKEHTIQVDYAQPIKKVNMEAGVKAILRDSKSDFEYHSLDSATNTYEVDKGMSNMFNYTQDVFGAYNSYNFNSNSWSFSAGLRAEETHVNADFMSTSSNTTQNYFNVVPALSINKTFKDNSSINFGFTQRIRRPSIYRLNPFVDRSNPDFISEGNPDLRPVSMNILQVGYSNGGGKRVSVNLSSDYSFFNNLDLPITNYNQSTGVTTTTYENTGKGGGVEINFNINYAPSKLYNLGINGNLLQLFVNGSGDAASDKLHRLMGHVSLSNGFRFDKGWSMNANVDYYTKTPYSLQGTYNSFVSTSVSINKELVKNKLYFSAYVNNPLNKFRNHSLETTGPDFIQTGNNQMYFRSFGFSLNYNFGKLNNDIKKSRKEINNDDVSKSKGGGL